MNWLQWLHVSLTKRHVQILKSITAVGVHQSTVQLGIRMVSLKDFGMKSGHMPWIKRWIAAPICAASGAA